tara:strand:- start:190 stop:1296 length:1107 start_codon:yes stop_codon:yes gene_type:complete
MVDYDEVGPEKIVDVYHPKTGMRGFVVIDSNALGPAKGGIRMTPTVSVDEVARLARAMTWKNALADLPFGGGKSGIIGNDKQMSVDEKKDFVRAFGDAMKVVCPDLYVAAPDMNMAEEEMEIFSNAVGSKKACTGKPKEIGGIPHELGSTGFGVFHALKVACEHKNFELKDVSVAIEGFGNVGWFVAKYLSEVGAKIVAVSDSRGVICNKEGLNFEKLAETKKEKGTVTEYGDGEVLPSHEILKVEADIFVTAAIPDLIKENDVDNMKFKIIVEGSNIPMTSHVEELLYNRGVLVVPDFVANAGGVISSYVEYIGGSVDEMWKMVEEKVVKNTEHVLKTAEDKKCSPRECALEIAKKRVLDKCKICRV